MNNQSTIELLNKFVAGWNAHNIDMLLECMADDALFYSSLGPEPDGMAVKGITALRSAFKSVWLTYPDAAWNDVQHIVASEYAVTTWRFTGTKADGSPVNVRGCDIFQIERGKIAVKDTFRKQITEPKNITESQQ